MHILIQKGGKNGGKILAKIKLTGVSIFTDSICY